MRFEVRQLKGATSEAIGTKTKVVVLLQAAGSFS